MSAQAQSAQQPEPTTGGGWVLVPGAVDGVKILVYIPPRNAASDSGTRRAPGGDPEPGLVQRAFEFGADVEMLSVIDGRALLVLAPQSRGQGQEATMRRVLGKLAFRSPAAAIWSFAPRGRMETFPVLPGSGELLAVVSGSGESTVGGGGGGGDAPTVPVVHIRGLTDQDYQAYGGEGDPPRDAVLRLGRRAWTIVDSPSDVRDGAWSFVRLVDGPRWVVSDGESWYLYDVSGDRVDLPPPRSTDSEASGTGVVPALEVEDWLGSTDTMLHASGSGLIVFREQPENSLALASWDQTGWYELGQPIAAPSAWHASFMEGGARVGIITTERTPVDDAAVPMNPEPLTEAAPVQTKPAYTITELSTITGDQLYSGDTVGPRVISPLAMQLLLVSVLLLTGAALFVALRSDPLDGAVPLPDSVPLASHSQRVLAQLIDILFAIAAGGLVTGTSMLDLFEWDTWLHSRDGWVLLFVSYILLWAHAVTMDVAAGGTLGRMLTGTRVVRLEMPAKGVDSGSSSADSAESPAESGMPTARPSTDGVAHSASRLRTPRIGQSLMRNTLKLALPPLGILMLLDPSGRHRAEQLSKTAVVAIHARSPGAERDQGASGDG